MDNPAINPEAERNVTPKIYHVRCAACGNMFESPSSLARTCDSACRQRKHRSEKKTLREKHAAISRELVRISGELAGAEQIVRGLGLQEVGDTIAAAVAKMGELDA